MDDESSKSLRERLDALLRRAREISAQIEKRVGEVTAEPATSGSEHASHTDRPAAAPAAASPVTPEKVAAAQEAMQVAAEAVAVTAEAAAVTAEALSTIADENGTAPVVPPAPAEAPTTVVPEAAAAVAKEATGETSGTSPAAEGVQQLGATETPGGASPAKPDDPKQ